VTVWQWPSVKLSACFPDDLDEPAPERLNQSGFNEARDDGVAVASAEPRANICTSLQSDNHTNGSSHNCGERKEKNLRF